MKKLSIEIPDTVQINEDEVKIIIAGKLYEQGKLSLGQAAELAGLSKTSFIEILGKFGFSLFSNSVEDLHHDIKNA